MSERRLIILSGKIVKVSGPLVVATGLADANMACVTHGTAMERPFWGGECQVKSCCEDRKLNHCGECPKFPCDMLSNMGKDQGFDPLPKIEMCRKWIAEKK